MECFRQLARFRSSSPTPKFHTHLKFNHLHSHSFTTSLLSSTPWKDYHSKLPTNDIQHRLLKNQALINGEWINEYQNNSRFDIKDKASLEIISTVPNMTANETTDAINAAHHSLKEWQNLTSHQRCDIVNKIAQLMILYKEPLSRILTAESGKPLAEARVEIIYASNFFKYFAEEGRRLYGDIIPPLKKHQQIFVTKEAIGVCGIITPWNFPSAMITRKLAPLLVVGCSAVIKPASETPLSALAIAQICMEAGVIPGVINVITSSVENSKMVGREICSNKIVRKFSFTGSTATGMNLAAQCTSTLKRMSLELGGNAPFIVFKDADIDEAVRGAYVSKFRNSGQTCVCTNRFFVQREIYDEFVEKFHGFVRREINFERNIGHGFAVDESEHGFCSKMGPLIDMKGVLKVEQHLKNSVSDGNGGEIVFGGKRMTVQHLESETFFEPTIVANVDVGNMQCLSVSNEETFGPLAIMIAFDDEQQVIQMANETDYGLCAYFYTKDMNRVFRMSEQLEYGMVGVNTGMISREIAPFGGVKFSGMGREGSKYGLDEYINIKYTCIESS